MKSNKEIAIILANRTIGNPKLLDQLNDDTFIKFVIGISNHSTELAHKVMDLRENVPAQNKILFWEAVGIIKSEY